MTRPAFYGPRRVPVLVIESWPLGSTSLLSPHYVIEFEPGGERVRVPWASITFQ